MGQRLPRPARHGVIAASWPHWPDQMTIYEAAAAPESLAIILAGTVFVLPIILGYTALAYTIFRGKAVQLSYD